MPDRYLLELSDGRTRSCWALGNPPTSSGRLQAAYRFPGDALALHAAQAFDAGEASLAVGLKEGIAAGSLRFELAGKRLHGGFVLAKTVGHRPHVSTWSLRRIEIARPPAGPLVSASTSISTSTSAFDELWHGVFVSDLEGYYRRVYAAASEIFNDRSVQFLLAPEGIRGTFKFCEAPMHSLTSEADFTQAARMKGIELHVPNYRNDEPYRPDFLFLDFDGAFDRLRSVALAAIRLLDELGLSYAWKLSGGRGLHLMVPIVRSYETTVVCDFAEMLAELIHESVPQHSTIEATIDATTDETTDASSENRVFINYRRNFLGERIVAPFSPRAGSRPVVSLPVSSEWLIDLCSASKLSEMPHFCIDLPKKVLEESGAILRTAINRPNDLESAFASIEWMARKAE